MGLAHREENTEREITVTPLAITREPISRYGAESYTEDAYSTGVRMEIPLDNDFEEPTSLRVDFSRTTGYRYDGRVSGAGVIFSIHKEF